MCVCFFIYICQEYTGCCPLSLHIVQTIFCHHTLGTFSRSSFVSYYCYCILGLTDDSGSVCDLINIFISNHVIYRMEIGQEFPSPGFNPGIKTEGMFINSRLHSVGMCRTTQQHLDISPVLMHLAGQWDPMTCIYWPQG